MNKIILSRDCEHLKDGVCLTVHTPDCPDDANDNLTCIITRPMTPSEQQEHHAHIIARANQSATAQGGFANNSLFFLAVVMEAHTFTDKDGVEWQVSLTP